MRSDDRGQLILVGALAIAVSFVVLALVLNSGIYAHNLASRTDTSSSEATEFVSEVRSAVGGLMDRASRARPNSRSAQVNVLDPDDGDGTAGVADVEAALRRYEASGSTYVETTLLGTSADGARLADVDGGTFVAAGGATDWYLTDDQTGLRGFRMTVERSSLATGTVGVSYSTLTDPGISPVPFRVKITQGGNTWTVFVYQDGSDTVIVKVYDSASGLLSQACTATENGAGRVTIDLTGARVGGNVCEPLQFIDPGPDHEIRYQFADAVEGTYRLVVSEVADAATGNFDNDFDDAQNSPYVAVAVYSVDVRVLYRSTDLTYETTLRVAPGEPDE